MKIRKILLQFVLINLLLLHTGIHAQEASPSASIETTDLTLNIEQNSGIINDKTVVVETTGTATAEASIIQNINQTTVGNDLTVNIVNSTDSNNKPINLSQNSECRTSQTDNLLDNTNINSSSSADINNNIDVSVIASGSATVQANIVTIVNTNLIGNCGSFNVINLLDKQEGDIILPNEKNYIKSGKPVSGIEEIFVTNNNNVNNDNNIYSTTTAKNGSANNIDNILTIANINIVGNNRMYLRISNFGIWNGSTDKEFTYWWYEESVNTNDRLTVMTNNNSKISNKISIKAESTITGNALAIANVFNLINTNIIGNNWFFVLINNFNEFTGRVVFDRPPPLPTPTPTPTVTAVTAYQTPLQSSPVPTVALSPTSTPIPSPTVVMNTLQETPQKVLGIAIKNERPRYTSINSTFYWELLLVMLAIVSGSIINLISKKYEN